MSNNNLEKNQFYNTCNETKQMNLFNIRVRVDPKGPVLPYPLSIFFLLLKFPLFTMHKDPYGWHFYFRKQKSWLKTKASTVFNDYTQKYVILLDDKMHDSTSI